MRVVTRDHTTHHLASTLEVVALGLVIEHRLILVGYFLRARRWKFLCGSRCASFVRQVVTLHLIQLISDFKDVLTATLKCPAVHRCVHIKFGGVICEPIQCWSEGMVVRS